jgi:hypothetical protein
VDGLTVADDLKELRQKFNDDHNDWQDAREARARDLRALAGDPWKPEDRQAREDNGRPCLTFDELTQHVNQIVNEFRANPLSVQFAPGPPLSAGPEVVKATEEAAEVYADAMREMEYRCNATEVYTTAAENAVQGGYGFVRLVSEFAPKSFQQQLALKAVPDPNTIVPNWDFQKPDLSDMRRCFVLEHRSVDEFRQQFPKAKIQDFSAYLNDGEYSKWVVSDKRILLAEAWEIRREPVKLLFVQPPPVMPPAGQYGFRGPTAPPPITILASEWATMPSGSKVIEERDDTEPKVVQQIVNGCEVLKETTWPGPYIPIAGCLGRIMYLDDGSERTKRLLFSAVRLALDPFMAYCFYRTSEIENVGMTTKNPYWAYEGQLDPVQQTEIAKSMHEPVAVLFAKAVTESTGQQILPLPQRNVSEPAIQALSVGAEECRRAVLSALGESALPTSAQRQNEKSRVALDKIEQSRQKGTYHFFDHYKGMIRHVGCLFEAAFDTFYDTKREIAVRRRDETPATIAINDPTSKEAVDVRGSYSVTVSSGPNVDSTREAASKFADNLLGAEGLMQMLGPQKAQKIAALAVKLKVKQTGIGAIGEEIVDIIDPPQNGPEMTPEQMQQQLAELQGQLQQAQQMLQQAAMEQEAGLAKERAKTERDLLLSEIDERLQRHLQAVKGQQAVEQIQVKGAVDLAKQDDAQRHDVGLGAAEAEEAKAAAQMSALQALAKPQDGNGKGSSKGAK